MCVSAQVSYMLLLMANRTDAHARTLVQASFSLLSYLKLLNSTLTDIVVKEAASKPAATTSVNEPVTEHC